MPDHLSLFEPYTGKDPHHEDALTRAFLVVLRAVPLAHAAWLGLVDHGHRLAKGTGIPGLHTLGAPEVRMQTSKVPTEVERLVSVIQTDEHYFRDSDARPSERRQVLDGLLIYGGTFAIALENKPLRGNIWEGQLDVNVPAGVEHDARVACVTWKDIVSAWGTLLAARHLGRAEQTLVGDFLDYVEDHFPQLRPYSSVALCGRDLGRLRRRSRALLDAIAPGHVRYHQGWAHFIDLPDQQCARKFGLFPVVEGGSAALVLELDPGDTMSQAKAMYGTVPAPDLGALLAEKGWSGRPAFHLMFMTTGFFRPPARLTVMDYWRTWADHPKLIRQWKRDEFESAFEALRAVGVVDDTDPEAFEAKTSKTQRNAVSFAPGLCVQWRIPVEEAAPLDDRGELVAEVRRAIERCAQVFRLRLPG